VKTASNAFNDRQDRMFRRHGKRMKLGVVAVCFALLGTVAGFSSGTDHAKARPGTGSTAKYFQIYSRIDFVEQHRWVLDVATGSPSNGWVYGNRLHYLCAYWFLYRNGNPVAKVEYQRVNDAPYLKVNDKFGSQHPFQPGEECGETEEYEQNDKPAGLPSTTVLFQSGGETLNSLVFPSTSPMNADVWFELDEQGPNEVKIEQYRVDSTTALITIIRLDPNIELNVVQE
jgi:hypothetical protein